MNLKIYQLPKPTEAQIQQEIQNFEWLNRQYHETLNMIHLKKLGYFPMLDLDALQAHAEQQRLEAYHKIPTLWLIELQELLNQKNITV